MKKEKGEKKVEKIVRVEKKMKGGEVVKVEFEVERVGGLEKKIKW